MTNVNTKYTQKRERVTDMRTAIVEQVLNESWTSFRWEFIQPP